MQPDMAGWVDAVRQQGVMGAITTSAGEAPAGRRALEIAVQPFDDAAFESQCLCVWAWQPAIKLGDACALIEMRLPLLGRRTATCLADSQSARSIPGTIPRATLGHMSLHHLTELLLRYGVFFLWA